MRLNLGCNVHLLPGHVNVDLRHNEYIRPDVVADVSHLPFRSESVVSIVASHVLEHVEDVEQAMAEACRVLVRGGYMVVTVPHYASRGAWIDPTHRRAFGWATMDYFVRDHPMHYYDMPLEVVSHRAIVECSDALGFVSCLLMRTFGKGVKWWWNFILPKCLAAERFVYYLPFHVDGEKTEEAGPQR